MQKTIVQLFDDLDGNQIDSGNGRTVTFAFDGKSYEIDLRDSHIDELRNALDPYIRVARRAEARTSGGAGRAGRAASSRGANSEIAAIRDWANANGIEVAQRGRISAQVREQYLAATGRR